MINEGSVYRFINHSIIQLLIIQLTGIELPPPLTPPLGAGSFFSCHFFAGGRPQKMTRMGALPPRLRIEVVEGFPLPAGKGALKPQASGLCNNITSIQPYSTDSLEKPGFC